MRCVKALSVKAGQCFCLLGLWSLQQKPCITARSSWVCLILPSSNEGWPYASDVRHIKGRGNTLWKCRRKIGRSSPGREPFHVRTRVTAMVSSQVGASGTELIQLQPCSWAQSHNCLWDSGPSTWKNLCSGSQGRCYPSDKVPWNSPSQASAQEVTGIRYEVIKKDSMFVIIRIGLRTLILGLILELCKNTGNLDFLPRLHILTIMQGQSVL